MGESPWTFRNDDRHCSKRALRLILNIIDREGKQRPGSSRDGRPHVVIGQDWWVHRLLEYLALERRDLRVVDLNRFDPDTAKRLEFMVRQVRSGAFVVTGLGSPIEGHLKSMFPGQVETWDPPYRGYAPWRILRLSDPSGAASPGVERVARAGERS